MYTAKRLSTRIDKFHAWLKARGAEVLIPTNEWEVLRFRTNSGTSIIYRNKSDRLTFTGDAEFVLHAFMNNGTWRAIPATKRKLKSTPVCRALRERDGDDCFYCRKPVEVEDESIEHLVAITHGGPDHIANMVLAHRAPCNAEAGHLSVMEKILRREATLAIPPVPTGDLGPPWDIDK